MATYMQKYPFVGKYKVGGSYPGCVVWVSEPGVGVILHIPNTTGANATIVPLERVTVAISELDPFTGGVVLRSSSDPTLIT